MVRLQFVFDDLLIWFQCFIAFEHSWTIMLVVAIWIDAWLVGHILIGFLMVKLIVHHTFWAIYQVCLVSYSRCTQGPGKLVFLSFLLPWFSLLIVDFGWKSIFFYILNALCVVIGSHLLLFAGLISFSQESGSTTHCHCWPLYFSFS